MKKFYGVAAIAIAVIFASVAMKLIPQIASTSALPNNVRATLPANAAIIEDKNFAVTVVTNEEENTMDIDFYNAKGDPITQFMARDGKVEPLDNIVWSGQYQLEKTPPVNKLGMPLVMLRSQEMLPMGMGELGTASLYWIHDNVVEEVLRVVTKREWSASDAPVQESEAEAPEENISMSAQLTCDWNMPACKYDYGYMDENTGTIDFEWDAQKDRFIDPLGNYDALKASLKL